MRAVSVAVCAAHRLSASRQRSASSSAQPRKSLAAPALFFALGPGQVIGYGRNEHTIAELDRAGYAVIPARDIIAGNTELKDEGRCVVTIDGSELARGGGGCRCMTLPIGRLPLDS